MDDYKLISLCQNGNKSAFQELITKYHPLIFRYLIKLAGNYQIAEDLTQDTFLKVIKNIDKFELGGKAKFSTYIITIAKNCYIDEFRKGMRTKNIYTIDESFEIEDINIDVENSVINKLHGLGIIDKMGSLPEEQQVVIKLKYIEELTLKEIGEILNLEPKTIKSRIHNGITKLRRMLEGDE